MPDYGQIRGLISTAQRGRTGASYCMKPTMPKQRKIIIAGAGIIGAAIAYQLARAGASVTVVEKGVPGQGATANSFAWINASRGKKPYHYYLLNRLGIAAWSDLEKQLPGKLLVRWGGSLEWHHDAERAARSWKRQEVTRVGATRCARLRSGPLPSWNRS